MIVVRIWEGLGNQLFQYVYARSLQERIQETVYLDRRHCNRGDLPYEQADVHRKLGLQHFHTSLHYVNIENIKGLCFLDKTNDLRNVRYSMRKNGVGKWRIVDDVNKEVDFVPQIYDPRDFTYINAHCVNRRYFCQYRNILLDELQLKKDIEISPELRRIMSRKNTVSVHIRLTDFLNHPGLVLDRAYYNRAIQYMKDNTENPYFVIFSDNVSMAKRRYPFSGNVYWASDEHLDDYEELMLMSRCRHNIMAKSTFSYWGAWLNPNAEKIVIGAKNWIRDSLFEQEWLTF